VKLMLVKGWLGVTSDFVGSVVSEKLLPYVANFMHTNLNLGGREGVHMCSIATL
jgi:hypothetical protein